MEGSCKEDKRFCFGIRVRARLKLVASGRRRGKLQGSSVLVEELRAKDEYDGKTRDGPWANMCEYHFRIHDIDLGVEKGQKLIEDKRQTGL